MVVPRSTSRVLGALVRSTEATSSHAVLVVARCAAPERQGTLLDIERAAQSAASTSDGRPRIRRSPCMRSGDAAAHRRSNRA